MQILRLGGLGMDRQRNDPGAGKRVFIGIGLFSGAAVAGLVWLLYVAVPAQPMPFWAAALPGWNAICNACSALLAGWGWVAIRRGRRRTHRALMLMALTASAAFLTGYVVYHHYHGDTVYGGQGFGRVAYLALLVSHILSSVAVLPLLLAVLWLAVSGRFEAHRRLARWVWPLWMYVGVTGVAVFYFLRPYY
jgi:putative membrane protein